jgi:hypothetical protein
VNADQVAVAIRNIEAIYRDAGDNPKAEGLHAFANLLAESNGVSLAQWCKSIAAENPAKKPAKRLKKKA